MTIALTTPEQINMWVLLSRRGQVKLHLKGLKTAGLLKWLKANIPDCENARTVKQCVVPLEFFISQNGGPADYSLVNLHLMEDLGNGMFADRGIFPDAAAVEANAGLTALYMANRLEIVYTLDEPRDTNGQMYEPA